MAYLFTPFFYIWTCLTLVLFSPSFVSFNLTMKASIIWAKGVVWGLRVFGGVESKVIGLETLEKIRVQRSAFSKTNNQPQRGFVVACKHQSAWETIVPYLYVPGTSYVYKKELGYIPFFGWYNVFLRNIAVDRKAGAKALKIVTEGVKRNVAAGRGVMIYPEGTRVPVGKKVKYKPAIYSIYKEGVKVIPAAVNSGYFWPKGKFLRKKGTIVFSYLEPMPDGLSKQEFMQLLETRIETECERLTKIYPVS